MNKNLNIVLNRFIVDNQINTIEKLKFGFVNTDCSFIKNILLGASCHIVNNIDILDRELKNDFDNLLMRLFYG